MIHVETKDGVVNSKIDGDIKGDTLICEAVASVLAVVKSLSNKAEEKGFDKDYVIKRAYADITRVVANVLKDDCGVDVVGNDTDDNDSEDDDEETIVMAVPNDSDLAKALMELLDISEDDETEDDETEDDETEDDIPDFLF